MSNLFCNVKKDIKKDLNNKNLYGKTQVFGFCDFKRKFSDFEIQTQSFWRI